MAARIDYGFYTDDAGLIEAVHRGLSADSRDPWEHYLRAYAAYRLLLLHFGAQDARKGWIGDCIDAAGRATQFEETRAEALVLVVACSTRAAAEEPMRGVAHQRRARRAAAEIEAIDPENPRFLLLRHSNPAVDGTLRPTAERVLAAFDARNVGFAFPDWGEAETYVVASGERLRSGDRRGARDFVEAALLLAPDYAAAQSMAAVIASGTTP